MSARSRSELRLEHVRLLTLTGPGGVGKTRLALDAARTVEGEFEGGASFVSLAPIARPEHLVGALADAIGVVPTAGESPQDAVERFLRPKHALVVLDNFEHLLSAAPTVTELLAQCPSLTVLATSREPLRLEPEHRFEVSPLPVPVDALPDEVERTAATALFIERARRHGAGFGLTATTADAITGICRRLDGLPLAIELAAARTPLLDPEELNSRLRRALRTLGAGPRDAPARQRTLRATVEWSCRLLNPEEASAFARFAVFKGGATIEAAEQVLGADVDTLNALVNKHLLVRRQTDVGTRLQMLETVREYADELLSGEELGSTHERHCQHYLELASRAERALSTRGEAEWLAQLDAETDNLRAVLDWSLTSGDPALALRLVGVLATFWGIRGRNAEGREWIETALRIAGDKAPILDVARARRADVYLSIADGYADAETLRRYKARGDEAVALARRAQDPMTIGQALLARAALEMVEPLPQPIRWELADEALSLAQEAGDDRLVALALMERASALKAEDATADLERAAAALDSIGAVRLLVVLCGNAAYNAMKDGCHELAGPLLEQARPLVHQIGDPWLMCFFCGNSGLEALFTGEVDRAQAAFEEQARLCVELVAPWLASEALGGLAAIATCRDEPERAARLLGAASMHGAIGDTDVTRELEEAFFVSARARCSERRWSDAYAAGRRLNLQEAIALAVQS